MNKRMLRLLFCLLLTAALSGCTRGLQSKTVIIPDQEDQSVDTGVSGAFAVNKIYKLLENETDNSDIVGWIDNEYVLAFTHQNRERMLGRLDYQYQTSQALNQIAINAKIGGLSPDGQTISLSSLENGKEIIKCITLKNGHATTAAVLPGTSTVISSLQWSNNSRYLSFIKADSVQKTAAIVVYDTTDQTMSQYQIADWNRGIQIDDVKIADKGDQALFVQTQGNQTRIVYGSLKGQAFARQYEQQAISHAVFDFVNNDQFLYVGNNGALTLFDHRTGTSAVLVQQIDTFGLAGNGKEIVYSKDMDTLYAARLQGNRVMNEKEIYKGMISALLSWSPDGRKILIIGRKPYESRPAVTATVQVQTPLIIELK